MAKIEGLQGIKTYVGEYDFAVDGGAVSTIVLRSPDGSGPIPSGSYITGGLLDVLTGFTTGAGAVAGIQAEAANDIVASTIVSGAPYSTTGTKSIIPAGTGATAVKTTAARAPAIVIGTGAITAGKCRLVLYYK
jgi:hypothetical protein